MPVNTETFVQNDLSYSQCLYDVLTQVNTFIKENDIRKKDIIEYRTDRECKDDGYWICVTLSWWSGNSKKI